MSDNKTKQATHNSKGEKYCLCISCNKPIHYKMFGGVFAQGLVHFNRVCVIDALSM